MPEGDGEGGVPAQETISREEFAELKDAVGGLTSALEELKAARTEPERRDAQEGVAEAKADLKTLAKELGIDPKRLEDAAAEAKKAERREELRPLLLELLDEELADDLDDQLDDALDGGKPKPKDDGPKPEPKDDSTPIAEHWSEKGIGALLGR